MKVILIRCGSGIGPRETNVTGCYPPLGLAYVAASLRDAGYNVGIMDAEVLQMGSREVLQCIPADARIIGFTSTTLGWPVVREIAGNVKKAFPESLLVIGGPHVTAFPEDTLEAPVFDIGVVGDGEKAMVSIADHHARGVSMHTIAGCVTRTDAGSIRSLLPPPWIQDLDSLPFPALDLLPMDRYRSVMVKEPFVTMVTSRGCPYRCNFCSQIYGGNKLRTRSPENIVDEMEQAVKRYQAKEIILFDETFGVKRNDALRVCALIRNRKLDIRWSARTRIDVIDEQLLSAMRGAGCYALHLGVESGTERILRAMNKKITVAQVRSVASMAHRLGFKLHAYFMIGYPGETRAEIDETLRLSRQLNLDWASYTITIPNPHTPLLGTAVSQGILQPDFWRNYTLGNIPLDIPFFASGECPESYLKRAKRSAYLRFYLRPGTLLRNLAFFLETGGWRRLGTAFLLWLREETI